MYRFWGNPGAPGWCGGSGGIIPWGGILMGFVFLILAAVLIYVLLKGRPGVSGSGTVSAGEPHYISELKAAFATGRITEEEYRARLTVLRENR